MAEFPITAISDYTSDGLRRAFGISARRWAERGAIGFVFKHYAGENGTAEGRAKRLRLASMLSENHIAFRYAICRANEDTFLQGSDKRKRKALHLAVICGDELLKDIKEKDFFLFGKDINTVRQTIEDARRIQREADSLRESSDIDFEVRPGRPILSISREGAFLAHINLYAKMCVLKSSGEMDFDTLSDHLRYDLICAPRYLSKNRNWGQWGREIAQELDMWEDQIVEILSKGSPLVNLTLVGPSHSRPSSDVIAFRRP